MKALPQQMFRHLLASIATVALAISANLTLAPQAKAQGTGYWHTSGNHIVDSCGSVTRINGISWSGFETQDYVIHDLWNSGEDYTAIMANIKTEGFNTIRIPWSDELVESNWNTDPPTQGQLTGSPELQGLTSGAIFDAIIKEAGTLGLKVILDNHRSGAQLSTGPNAYSGNEPSGLWYTPTFPEANWIADWQFMINRYAAPGTTYTDANGNPTVIGVDIRNEPHLQNQTTAGGWNGSCWTGDTTSNDADTACPAETAAGAYSSAGVPNDHNWPSAAARGGDAVLAINPHLLIFVQGVDVYDNNYRWAGGNLEGAGANPVTLSVPNQLVYTAHDYGPEQWAQPWLNTGSASSLISFWDTEWGYLTTQTNPVPVWVGEFGTQNVNNNTNDIPAGDTAPPSGGIPNYPDYPAGCIEGSTCTTVGGPYPTGASTSLQVDDSTSGSEGFWFNSLIDYLQTDPTGANLNWSYWTLNGSDPDGLMNSTMSAVAVPQKLTALVSIESPVFTGDVCSVAPAAPTGIAATGETSSSITLSWTASSGTNVTYTVYYSTASGVTTSTGTPFSAGSSTTATVTGLNSGTTYYFIVVASDAGGASGASSQVSGATSTITQSCSAVPSAPAGLTALASSTSAIQLAWSTVTPPANCTIASYSVISASGLPSVTGVAGTSYTSTGLNPGTQYCYAVEAVDSYGSSSPSSPVCATTQTTAPVCTAAPPAPGGVTATASTTADTITLSWNPVTPQTGCTVSTYNIYRSNTSGTLGSLLTSPTASPYSDTGLAASTQYCYTVEAVDSQGNSVASTQSCATTPASTQSSSCNIVYTVSNSWTSGSTNDFQAAVTIDNESTSGLTNWTLDLTYPNTTTSIVSGDVWNGTLGANSGGTVSISNVSYNGTIAAGGNYGGLSFQGTYASGTTPVPTSATLNGSACTINGTTAVLPSVPAAPSGLQVTSTTTGSASLSWTASTTSGVTYDVYYSTSAAVSTGNGTPYNAGSSTSATIPGLSANTTYYFIVVAVNAAGDSAPSNTANGTTLVNAPICSAIPAVPSGLVATASSSSAIGLAWNADATPASCSVTYTVDNSSNTQLASGLITESYSATGLSANTNYCYTVKAVDAAGTSAASAQSCATTQPVIISAGQCHVVYTLTNSWSTGGADYFQAAITVENTGTTALNNWTLAWTYPNTSTKIVSNQVWNGTLGTNSGGSESISNLSYNGTIPAGGSYSGMGFLATFTGTNTNPAPAAFTLNGVPCD